ncbi:hypothetical protein HU200_050357 [Digitaria exilis]|uniref:Uncharacterized protein n=1 Tax=Digitaria exilis TaxID=1010633 RepID=A0A835EAL6_9POAL|nr:hypothetical protein HU200_050357 [Digitaria exilis]
MVEAVGSFGSRGIGVAGMSSTLEEVQMQETLIFSDTIKDLKTLRSQLYSAAEYFELAYMQEDGKQAVMSNLKEYAVKALVNTVDHLGSISFKVTSLIDQRIGEVADANLRVSSIQQRTQVSQACMDREGLSQQSLVITAPKYHKRYILPAGDQSMPSAVPNFREMNKVTNRTAQMHQLFSAAQPKAKDKQPSFSKLRSIARAPSQRARSASPAQRSHSIPPSQNVIPTNKDRRSVSPIPTATPLTRSGSLSMKASLLKTSSVRVQNTSQPKKLAPLRSQVDRSNDTKDGEHTPKKSKKFLKSILSRRKSKKDEPLPSYFDDY